MDNDVDDDGAVGMEGETSEGDNGVIQTLDQRRSFRLSHYGMLTMTFLRDVMSTYEHCQNINNYRPRRYPFIAGRQIRNELSSDSPNRSVNAC